MLGEKAITTPNTSKRKIESRTTKRRPNLRRQEKTWYTYTKHNWRLSEWMQCIKFGTCQPFVPTPTLQPEDQPCTPTVTLQSNCSCRTPGWTDNRGMMKGREKEQKSIVKLETVVRVGSVISQSQCEVITCCSTTCKMDTLLQQPRRSVRWEGVFCQQGNTLTCNTTAGTAATQVWTSPWWREAYRDDL